MPISWNEVSGKIIVGVITAIVLGILTIFANWASAGGLIRTLGGVTQHDVEDTIRRLAASGPPGPPGPKGDTGPQGPAAALPAGAVIAFDLPDGCPTDLGWTTFRAATGRTIIGAGAQFEPGLETDSSGTHLPTAKYRGHGGSHVHTLTLAEIPPHEHKLQAARSRNMQGANDYWLDEYVGRDNPDNDPHYNRTAYTEKAGGGSPFDIMNPYIALDFCKKN